MTLQNNKKQTFFCIIFPSSLLLMDDLISQRVMLSSCAAPQHVGTGHNVKEYCTVTLVSGGSREVEQFVERVVVGLNGVDVLVVWVIGVHHHTQLMA